MIPDIETILEDLAAGRISTAQATAWLHQHANGAGSDMCELRDHFAGLALSGFTSDPSLLSALGRGSVTTKQVCARAYELADAMLMVRPAR